MPACPPSASFRPSFLHVILLAFLLAILLDPLAALYFVGRCQAGVPTVCVCVALAGVPISSITYSGRGAKQLC